MRHKKLVFLLIGIVVVVYATTAFFSGRQEKAENIEVMEHEHYVPSEEETMTAQVGTKRITHDIPDTENLQPPFDSMSQDYGSDTLEGWWHYEIPEEYARTGGYLPDLVQVYTYALCQQENIDYPMVLAMIEVESGYHWDVQSNAGAIGYMQVVYIWHYDREPSLTEELLASPYVNIRVAVNYLKELQERFGSMEKVLTAYHYGVRGAKKYVWSQGKNGCAYSDKVLAARARILLQLWEREDTVNKK